MSSRDSKELRPVLDRAKATIQAALDEVCGTDLDRVDTGKFIRLEEVLAIANEAAKEVVSVRRRLRIGRERGDVALTTARQLTDQHGVQWAVFAVHPSSSSGRAAVRERFRDGWLSFDCPNETRRIAPIPPGWHGMADSDLLLLCTQAEPAPRRTSSLSSSTASPPATSPPDGSTAGPPG